MGTRTLLILTAIAGSLLAFIFFFERHELSSADLEARRGKLLETFLRDRVDRIEITRGKERVLLVKAPGPEGGEGEWRLEAPLSSEIDGNAIDTLLAALEWAQPRRVLEGIDADDRKRFGFDAPRVKVTYRVANRTTTFVIGEDDPMEGGFYLRVDDGTRAYVVGKDVFEAVDHGADHFRSKKLFSGLIAGSANRFRLRHAQGELGAILREGRWWLDTPFAGLASTAAVDDMHRTLEELEATRFVTEAPGDLAPYGLATPAIRLTVERPSPGDPKKTEERLFEVGSACGEHEGERYARAQKGPIVCVRAADLEPFERSVEDLREKRLVTARDHELEAIALAGKQGSLELRSTDGVWMRVTRKEEKTRVADGSVTEWIDSLREARVLEMVSPSPEHGLSTPRATMTLSRGEGRPSEVLKLGAQTGDRLFVQRGEEPWALVLDAGAEALFSASATRFRDRELLSEKAESLFEFDVERDGHRERVSRTGTSFSVVEPVKGPADASRAKEIASLVAGLTALRFVADRPTAAHALDRPRLTVRARFRGPSDPGSADAKSKAAPAREYRLKIGATSDDGAFATLGDDPAVFLLPRTLVDLLERPLLRADVLATEGTDLRAITIQRGPRTIELVHEGASFRASKGATPSPDAIRAVVDRLERLRAVEVRYGATPLERPRAIVTVQRTSDDGGPAEVRFAIGDEVGEGESARVRVRREDVNADFFVSREAVEPFLALVPR